MNLGHDENACPGLNTPTISVIQVYEVILDNFTPIYIFRFSFLNIKLVAVFKRQNLPCKLRDQDNRK
jgi:hypothetical protein